MDALRALGLEIPDDVLEQFLSDHGLNGEFQEQYGHLNLVQITWEKRMLTAQELIEVTVYEGFQRWTQSVAQRPRQFQSEGWKCIDSRAEVVSYWEINRTWIRPPILMDGSLLGRPNKLHLVEGHTRIGILRGLVNAGVVAKDSQHEVWLGY